MSAAHLCFLLVCFVSVEDVVAHGSPSAPEPHNTQHRVRRNHLVTNLGPLVITKFAFVAPIALEAAGPPSFSGQLSLRWYVRRLRLKVLSQNGRPRRARPFGRSGRRRWRLRGSETETATEKDWRTPFRGRSGWTRLAVSEVCVLGVCFGGHILCLVDGRTESVPIRE